MFIQFYNNTDDEKIDNPDFNDEIVELINDGTLFPIGYNFYNDFYLYNNKDHKIYKIRYQDGIFSWNKKQ